jgi:hypothetical protein
VHAARQDREDDRGSVVLRNEEAVEDVCCVFEERSDLSFIATEGGEQAFRKPWRARHGEAGGGEGARVREPSSHTLLPQGEELTLYVGPTPSKLVRWD